MENNRFDALTRAMGTADSRRGTLRALGGTLLSGVVGGLAAKLGLGDDEDAAARGKKRGRQHDGRKREGHVQAAGKKRKRKNRQKDKKKDKDKDKDKDKPNKPQPCKPGFRPCSGGTCIADKPFICCIDETICPGGRCALGECCPAGNKYCGLDCIPENECCELEAPLCGECKDHVCVNGNWECRQTCQGDETCCLGVCIPPCTNGCTIDDGCGHCNQAPAGKLYCDGQDRCINACPVGKELDTVTCQCRDACPGGDGFACGFGCCPAGYSCAYPGLCWRGDDDWFCAGGYQYCSSNGSCCTKCCGTSTCTVNC